MKERSNLYDGLLDSLGDCGPELVLAFCEVAPELGSVGGLGRVGGIGDASVGHEAGEEGVNVARAVAVKVTNHVVELGVEAAATRSGGKAIDHGTGGHTAGGDGDG